ncbi:antitermination protein [Erwinia psidii]|uniref:Antitermination protein n=1 Tax=Erwinia psidii TaxID=69224 RepID=A0A3N6SQ89_9GAMM|nr:antitermination protein [Erwinia psidii]MCX8964306.1 antitermination protein [Erwinia psidii]RQM40006.1 antitermination protein [Erwinia psidii]
MSSALCRTYEHLTDGVDLCCTDNDALIIDGCMARLKQKRPNEYDLLFSHYVKGISKRALGRKLKLSEGMIRIKFQMAEGFVEGCLSMPDVRLEMDSK